MSNVSAKTVFIQIESAAEQQEHLKNQRKMLKVLQGNATDKENLAGRPIVDKLTRIKAATDVSAATEQAKRKKFETRAAETQTSPDKPSTSTATIAVEDLTSEAKPSAAYFELLAERRRVALEETLAENQRLHERIEGLEKELVLNKTMLEETRNLVEVLKEMLEEDEADQGENPEEGREEEGVQPLESENSNNTEP